MAERYFTSGAAATAYTDTSFPDVPAHTDSRHQSVDSFDGGLSVLRIVATVPRLFIGRIFPRLAFIWTLPPFFGALDAGFSVLERNV